MKKPGHNPAKRVLLIEDTAPNAVVYSAMLDQLGYDHEVHETGTAGIKALRSGSFALVLMDINLPDGDGRAFTRMIREDTTIPNRDLPIIALTAYSGAPTMIGYFEAGMDDYLAKPLEIEALKRILHTWLETDGMNEIDSFMWGFVPPQDNAPEFDREAMENFIGFMPTDRIKLTAEQFSTDYKERLVLMRQGIQSSEELREVLHPLIASSASMGLVKLSVVCRNIIDGSHADGYVLDNASVNQIDESYESGMAGFTDYINTLLPRT